MHTKTKTSKSEYSKARDRVDYWFSRFIRLRDTGPNGYGKCMSSGRIIHFDNADAGHFMSRRFMSTRWNEKNVHLQSRKANRFDQGQQYEMGRRIDLKHGEGTAELLVALSRKHKKYALFELKILADEYRKKCKELEKQKMFI